MRLEDIFYPKNNMKKIFFLICCLLPVACSEKIKNFPNEGASIVCFGDSLTAGYGATERSSYPYVLGTLITHRPVVNLGVSGDTSSDGLARIEEVFNNHPYMVLIEFGGNDFRRQVPPQRVKQNILEMVRMVQDRGAIAVVVDTGDNIYLGKYSQAMREVAEETNSIYIEPILDGILNNKKLKSDPIHPNADGYKIIAEKIYKQLQKYL